MFLFFPASVLYFWLFGKKLCTIVSTFLCFLTTLSAFSFVLPPPLPPPHPIFASSSLLLRASSCSWPCQMAYSAKFRRPAEFPGFDHLLRKREACMSKKGNIIERQHVQKKANGIPINKRSAMCMSTSSLCFCSSSVSSRPSSMARSSSSSTPMISSVEIKNMS